MSFKLQIGFMLARRLKEENVIWKRWASAFTRKQESRVAPCAR
jgi:hypothetical protein